MAWEGDTGKVKSIKRFQKRAFIILHSIVSAVWQFCRQTDRIIQSYGAGDREKDGETEKWKADEFVYKAYFKWTVH